MSLVASRLGFANGVIVSGDRVLVALTRDAAIAQFSVDAPPSDSSDAHQQQPILFARNLPCLPDNIVHYESRGLIAVGCASIRTQPFSLMDLVTYFSVVF